MEMTKQLKIIFLIFVDIGTFRGYIYNKGIVIETLKLGTDYRKIYMLFS
jgi:hypothetical protein